MNKLIGISDHFFQSMSLSGARALLLALFKSNQTAKTAIPPILPSFGHVQNYKSIVPSNDKGWTDALVIKVDDEQKLHHLDTKPITEAIQTEFNGENILIAPMIYSIECSKDTSSDPKNDVLFAIAFTLKEKLDQFPEDWFKATPYMSSCLGFKYATVYKVIGDNPLYPFINIAFWSSVESWKQAIGTEESKEAHKHQDHVHRTPFIGTLSQSSPSD